MMPTILKYLMCCHKPNVLAYLVALVHLALTARTIYFVTINFICYYNTEDNENMSKDDIFDMPITVVRYMNIMFILIVITSLLLLIGIAMKRVLCIASFMLTMGIFVITFGIFAICDVLEGLLEGSAFSAIFLEFMMDTTVLAVDIVLIYPVFLVFVDLTEPLVASKDQINMTKAKSLSNAKSIKSEAV